MVARDKRKTNEQQFQAHLDSLGSRLNRSHNGCDNNHKRVTQGLLGHGLLLNRRQYLRIKLAESLPNFQARRSRAISRPQFVQQLRSLLPTSFVPLRRADALASQSRGAWAKLTPTKSNLDGQRLWLCLRIRPLREDCSVTDL